MHCLSSRRITGRPGPCRETVRSPRGRTRSPGCPPTYAPTRPPSTPPLAQPLRETDRPLEPNTGCAPIPIQDARGYPGRVVRTPLCTPHCLIHLLPDSKALPHRPRASIEEEGRAWEERPVPPWQSTARAAAPGHLGESPLDSAPASPMVPAPRPVAGRTRGVTAAHGATPRPHWSQWALQPAGQ